MKSLKNKDAADVSLALMQLLPSIRNFLHDGLKKGESRLPRSQISLLMVLVIEGSQTMTDLHELLGIEKGSVTSVVDTLIDKGFVKRASDAEDRRKVLVSVTPKGKALADNLRHSLSLYIEEKISRLSHKDLLEMMTASKNLKVLLDKV